jgi:hypothetical protein
MKKLFKREEFSCDGRTNRVYDDADFKCVLWYLKEENLIQEGEFLIGAFTNYFPDLKRMGIEVILMNEKDSNSIKNILLPIDLSGFYKMLMFKGFYMAKKGTKFNLERTSRHLSRKRELN